MSRDLVLAGWVVLAVALAGCGLLPWLGGGRFATLFDLTRRLTRSRPALVAVFAGWLWIGWHFFAR